MIREGGIPPRDIGVARSDGERARLRAPSLVRRFIILCLGWYLVAAAAVEAIELASISRSVVSSIESHITSVVSQNLPALARTVWNMDYDIAHLIMAGLINDPAIGRLELVDENGAVVATVDAGAASSSDPAGDGSLEHPLTFPLDFSTPNVARQRLGTLVVYPSLASARANIRQSLAMDLGRTAAIVLVLSLILLVAVELYLGQPLRSLAQRVAEVGGASPGEFHLRAPPEWGPELSLVAESLNGMAARMGESMKALRDSERRLWSTFEDSPISIWDEDFSALRRRIDEARLEGVTDWEEFFAPWERVVEFNSLVRVRDVNRSTLRLLGASDKASLLGNLPALYTDDQVESMRREFVALAMGAATYEGESDYSTVDGKKISIQIKVSILPGSESTWDRVLASVVDISELKKTQRILVESLREKELLLREVHHRVKNNLQIVCSLVSLQRGDEDPSSPVAKSLAAIESRVWSMSLVHELLYDNDSFSSLDFASYARQLCLHLTSSSLSDPRRVRLELDIPEGTTIPLERAIPLGLVLNELVSNAIKHAFVDGKEGKLRVSFHPGGDGRLVLLVEDDGPGLAVDPLTQPRRSVGLGLVAGLAAQLGGSYALESDGGLRARVVFPAVAKGGPRG